MALFTAALWLGGTDFNDQLNRLLSDTEQTRLLDWTTLTLLQKQHMTIVPNMTNIILPLKI